VAPGTASLDSTIAALEEEVGRAPGPRTYAPLSEAYRLTGRFEDAVRVAREGATAHPGHVGIRMVLARALAGSAQTDEARRTYGEVLRLDPGNSEARIALGLLGRKPSTPPAEPTAPRPRAETPGSLSEELAHLSDLFSPRPETGLAERGYELSGIATLTLAEIYARQGFPQRAAEVCEMILERRPDDDAARARLAEYRRSLAALR
jgi:tetratricopeptide (TPR) repeat protein